MLFGANTQITFYSTLWKRRAVRYSKTRVDDGVTLRRWINGSRRFEGTYCPHLQGIKVHVEEYFTNRELLKKKATRSFETSCHIPEGQKSHTAVKASNLALHHSNLVFRAVSTRDASSVSRGNLFKTEDGLATTRAP